MTRVYYILYDTIHGDKVDRIIFGDPEDRPNFHKIEAFIEWKSRHIGYGGMIAKNHIFTPSEWKEYRRSYDCQ